MKASKKTSLALLAIFSAMLFLSSCGGHKLCGAYGGKTNTNSETIQE